VEVFFSLVAIASSSSLQQFLPLLLPLFEQAEVSFFFLPFRGVSSEIRLFLFGEAHDRFAVL